MALQKPRKRWTGSERSLLRKLQSSILQVQARDDRNSARSVEIGSTAYLFAQNGEDPVFVAMQTLLTRIDSALTETR